jgi:hypothetical protein
VYRGSLAELARAFPELVRGAFPGCRATARDHPAFRTGGGVLGTQTSLGGVPVSVPHALFHVTNLWLAKRRGLYIDVYAGSLATDERRGALSVTWTDPRVGLPQRRSGIYKAPERVGPLTLTRVAGDRVYFRYRGGSGWFDLRARRFTLRARR